MLLSNFGFCFDLQIWRYWWTDGRWRAAQELFLPVDTVFILLLPVTDNAVCLRTFCCHVHKLAFTLSPRSAVRLARRVLLIGQAAASPFFFSLCVASADCPDDVEQEEPEQQKEMPQPSEPSGAANSASGNRRNPPGGKSSLILGWDRYFSLERFSFFYFLKITHPPPTHPPLSSSSSTCHILPSFTYFTLTPTRCHIHGPPVSSPSTLKPFVWILFSIKIRKLLTKALYVSLPPPLSISAHPVVHRACWERHDV